MNRRQFLVYAAATATICTTCRSVLADWPGQDGSSDDGGTSGWPELPDRDVSSDDPSMGTNSRVSTVRFEGCNLLSTSRQGGISRSAFRTNSGFGARFDRAFYEEVGNLNRLTGLSPSFAFYNDGSSRNAFASSTDVIYGRSPHGAIGLGVNLLGQFMKMDTVNPSHNAAILEAVFVHEWAHIAQYAARLRSSRVKHKELMADFMAGWYIGYGIARGKDWDVRPGMQGVYSMGDTNFNDPQHHGTPRERLAAYDAGINFVRYAVARGQLPDFMAAFHYAAQDYVR